MPSPRSFIAVNTWFKSSYSGGNTTECVECSRTETGALVRDSKRPKGPVLTVQADAWSVFIEGISSTQACSPSAMRC
ncbi:MULTISPECIES: DUF397 domain-containing protein [Streptomyces]|uniref:DUF397 domain-containing protein n=1 Tax=Streptomyces venezuelae TaxID=54571 RepID=A0A5P2AUQ9_STRVZ|nr:DUF397 domain-containing protein [Streptomyces venezuelae]QES22004.1 DUF397 domain-containing protein [Streptomyces venezuelae]